MKQLIFLPLTHNLFVPVKLRKELSDLQLHNRPMAMDWRSTAGKASITPESVDSTYYIEFDSNGSYYVYDNSKKVISTAKYELILQENSNMYRIIDHTHVGVYHAFKVSNDTLTITNLEGFIKWTSRYLRIK